MFPGALFFVRFMAFPVNKLFAAVGADQIHPFTVSCFCKNYTIRFWKSHIMICIRLIVADVSVIFNEKGKGMHDGGIL